MKNQDRKEDSRNVFPKYANDFYDPDDIYYSTILENAKKRKTIKNLVIVGGAITILGATIALQTVEIEDLKEVTIQVEQQVTIGVNNEKKYTYVIPEGYDLRFEDNEPIGYKYEMGTYTLKEYLFTGAALKKTKR